MRISDWSSDVCSSDLILPVEIGVIPALLGHESRAGCRSNHASRERPMHRRQFLSTAAALAAAASFPTIGKARSTSRLRLGVIGTGMRGQVLLEELVRSEEHTSELQSLMRISYAVFCLKNKNIL